MRCLNIKNKEVKAAVDELTAVLGSYDAAYYVISENDGYAIDLNSDGTQSAVFNNYLRKHNGDKNAAILDMVENFVPATVEELVDMQVSMFPKLFTETDAHVTISNMMNSGLYYNEDFAKIVASTFSPEVLKGIKVSLVKELDGAAKYDSTANTILVKLSIFTNSTPESITKTFNHEIIHAYTVYEYLNNPKFKERVDKLFNKISLLFPSKQFPRKGLYYGLTDPYEFISEVMANSAFRDLVAKHDMPIWRKFLSTILDMLGLNKLSSKVKGYTHEKLINEIQDIINNRNEDPTTSNIGDGIFYMKSEDELLKGLSKDSAKVIEKIRNGLKARYRSLLSLNYPALLLSKIQLQIDMYTDLLLKENDKAVLIDFIKTASVDFKPTLRRIRNAYLNPDLITNDRLKQFLNDFLDFYGPVINEISKKLLLQGYFDDLDADTLNKLKTQVDLINRAYLEIEGKYNSILLNKVENLVRQYSEAYRVPKEDVDAYINDKLNSTVNDINLFRRLIQSTKSVDDLAIRLAHRLLTDINNQVSRFANNKAQELIREFDKIKRADCLLYFEKDNNGNTTGYLVRDRNYGLFKKDMSSFLKELDAKYGVLDNNYYALDNDNFFNYLKEKEEWLLNHCERKFKPEYYEAYNELKPTTRLRLKALNGEISNIISEVTDEYGPHLEKLSNNQWLQLDNLYSVKRNLANEYYQDGNLKDGEDKEIAEDLLKFYSVVGEGRIKSKLFTLEEIQDIIDAKKKELSKELFDKWVARNISYQYSQKFINLLKYIGKANTMGEDLEAYDSLIEERRKLLNLGKDNNQPYTIAYKLTESVKGRLLEIDNELNAIRSRHKGEKSEFSKIAKFEDTAEYRADKKKYKALGKDLFDEWFYKSHIMVNGRYVPVSYYRVMVPLDPIYIEKRLSRMNQELDKDSELVNKNYDFSNPEYYQPVKSLYDNTNAYKEATNTENKQHIYDLITSTIGEANSKISFLNRRDNYKLPLITGDLIDFAIRNNEHLKGLKEYALDDMVVKLDDKDYSLDNFTLKPDGSELYFVPTHYVKMLDNPEHISRNLVGMLVEYSRMAENYKLKNDKEADFELLSEQLARRDVTTFNVSTMSKQTVTGDKSNMYLRYRDFLEMNLYGQFKKPVVAEVGEYKISITKILDKIRSYATASNLSNNIPAITKALFQGIHKSVVEALAGRYFKSNNYFKSLVNVVFDIPNMLIHLGNPKHNNTLLALMEHNEIARTTDDKVSDLLYNRLRRIYRKYLLWGGWSAVDYLVKAPVLSAIYSDYKYIPSTNKIISRREYVRTYHNNDWKAGSKAFDRINSFTLHDVYEVKDGKPVIKEKYKAYSDAINDLNLQNSVKNITKFLTNRIDGVLSPEDKTRLMTNAFGAAVFMHRSFFINNLEDNLLMNYQYNPYIEDYTEAKYTSSFRALWVISKNIFDHVRYLSKDIPNNRSITDVQSYNLRRTLILLSLVTMYSILSAIWLKPSAEDDEDNWLLLLFGYSVAGMAFEERAEYNPMDLFNLIKSPSAAIAPVDNLTNVFKLFNPLDIENNWSDDEIKKGAYKDMHKWERSLIRAVPGLRGVWESRDVRTKWEYLDSQLDKQ